MIKYIVGIILGAAVLGPIAPDGTQVQIDLPKSQHLQNTGGSDGKGLCVFTSITHSARWSHVELLEDFRDYMKQFPGGGYPTKVTQYIEKIAKEKGKPVPNYVQIQGKEETLDTLKLALQNGLCPAVTYGYSPSGRYRGQRISHMVTLLHLDEKNACILDNNYPGTYEWMTPQEFYRTFTAVGGSGWAVILLDAGPPAFPWN